MLFVLVMEVLNTLVTIGDEKGLFSSLRRLAIQHNYLYTVDIMVFITPCGRDLLLVKGVLELFAVATGL
jgi:hypothetical protein